MVSDSGAIGWGESWAYPGAAAALVREHFAPALLGHDATLPRAGWQAMAARLGYDRRGISTMALGGLDVALWDLAGQIAGKPVHALLGGKLRSRIPAYVSGPFMKPGSAPYRDFEADIAGYLDAGFRAIKLRMGTDPACDGATARKVRAQIGETMPLMIDLNEGFSVEGGLAIAQRLAEVDPVWLEEPIAHDDLPALSPLCRGLADPAGGRRGPSDCAPSATIWRPASSTSSSPISGCAAGFPKACGFRLCAKRSRSHWFPMSGARSSTSRRRCISPPA